MSQPMKINVQEKNVAAGDGAIDQEAVSIVFIYFHCIYYWHLFMYFIYVFTDNSPQFSK